MNNIIFFEKILSQFKIKYNKGYLKGIVSKEPNSNTFFGMIAILKSYGLNGIPFIADEDVFSLKAVSFPVILHLENPDEIVLIYEEVDDYYKIVTEGGASVKIKKEDILKRWSKKVIQFSNGNGKESNFRTNFFIEKGKWVILSSFFLILVFKNLLADNSLIFNVLYALNNFIGLFICYKLHEIVTAQNQNNSKICNASHKTSCLSVLNHKSSKLFGFIPYDKIGFVYFLYALTAPVFFNFLESGLILFVLFSFSALFPIYSVYFQFFIVKKWCPLCLFIQGCILLNFVLLNFYFDFYELKFFSEPLFLLSFVILMVLIFSSLESQKNKIKYLQNRVNGFIRNDGIFEFLNQAHPELIAIPNKMAMANVKAESNSKITFVTNPFCPYCIERYNEIKRVIEYNEDVVFETIYCIPENVEIVSRITLKLIKIYFEIGVDKYNEAVKEWYDYGIENVAKWESKFNSLNENYENEIEVLKMHKEWCELVKINETPSVLFNNKLVPIEYTVSDFAYIG